MSFDLIHVKFKACIIFFPGGIMLIIVTWKTFSAFIAIGHGSTSENIELGVVPTRQSISLS